MAILAIPPSAQRALGAAAAARLRRGLFALIFLFTTPCLSGCTTLKYLIQATHGELALLNRARPIDEVIRDPRTPPRIKDLLARIPAIKDYGEKHGLKPTRNYTEYVKLDRAAAVWVVSACEPLRFKSKEWSFPIAGRFPYLGWFDKGDALEFADELRREPEGWDVDVRGAQAYSTLGWFRDAVLSTMIPEGKEALGELVDVVLHESVHATIYISGQAYFNESLASYVADRLAPQYLADLGPAHLDEKKAYVDAQNEYEKREKELHLAYEELSRIYASDRPDSEKLEEKKKILSALRANLGFKREINNATLIQYKTYNTGQAEFDALLHACGGNWARFLAALKELKPSSFSRPQQEDLAPVILPIVSRGCG